MDTAGRKVVRTVGSAWKLATVIAVTLVGTGNIATIDLKGANGQSARRGFGHVWTNGAYTQRSVRSRHPGALDVTPVS